MSNGLVRPRPIVALDIDGTLAYWHEHLLWFAGHYLGRELPDRYMGKQPFFREMGISKRTYREVKLAFRQSGLKRSMPIRDGAPSLPRALRGAGAEVWLCTTRPYLRLDNIDPDTREFLRRNGIKFDGVLFGEHKYSDLVKVVGKDRIVAVLDDLPEQCHRAASLGLPVWLAGRDYNTAAREVFPAIDTLEEAGQYFTQLVKEWIGRGNG